MTLRQIGPLSNAYLLSLPGEAGLPVVFRTVGDDDRQRVHLGPPPGQAHRRPWCEQVLRGHGDVLTTHAGDHTLVDERVVHRPLVAAAQLLKRATHRSPLGRDATGKTLWGRDPHIAPLVAGGVDTACAHFADHYRFAPCVVLQYQLVSYADVRKFHHLIPLWLDCLVVPLTRVLGPPAVVASDPMDSRRTYRHAAGPVTARRLRYLVQLAVCAS